ncbi:hypothetical protein FSP39_010744 [Pinctada imbricata]|uniref:RING-CH-type domain-containing protein n=1 Tax=Pinctada imbricata TaxID=66713 RepID=A0AA88XRI0_PINIB|nr:hypothetical protein FSP39_010744 [Pinctada imbricata]
MPLQQIAVHPSGDSQPNPKPNKKDSKQHPSPMKKKDSTKETHHVSSPTPKSLERSDTSLSMVSNGMDACRICQCDVCEIDQNSPLISPCLCDGSMKFVHQACLQKWIKSSDKTVCELCKYEYKMTSKSKPFCKWEKLQMTPIERRKITCSVTFHVIAITCVIWSLYVLIDRTTEEVEAGALDWPFWTKLIVVAIGFTGGLVFMYVQCKMYYRLCMKWKTFNRTIMVENVPEEERIKTVYKSPEKRKIEEEERGISNEAFEGVVVNSDML